MKTANRIVKLTTLSAILALSASFTGCVVVPAPPHRVYVGGVVRIAPPPVRVEIRGVAPGPGFVWIDGYWTWEGGRHVWIGGRWEAPRPGYYWRPHRWHHERDGWYLEEGHWDRR